MPKPIFYGPQDQASANSLIICFPALKTSACLLTIFLRKGTLKYTTELIEVMRTAKR